MASMVVHTAELCFARSETRKIYTIGPRGIGDIRPSDQRRIAGEDRHTFLREFQIESLHFLNVGIHILIIVFERISFLTENGPVQQGLELEEFVRVLKYF